MMFETKAEPKDDTYRPTTENLIGHLEHAANSAFERGVVAVLRSMHGVSAETSGLSEHESDEAAAERAAAATRRATPADVKGGTF